jgi:nitrite reductase/ring-hydroxylating ferredoxin subunit
MAQLIQVAPLEQFEDLEAVCIGRDGIPYCIIKAGEKVNAFVSLCTHKELAMFPPTVKRGLLVCPHHKVAFDPVTGEVADDRGKRVSDLEQVNVVLVDGMVYLEARKRHRKLVPRSERRWVKKETRKQERKRG